MLSFLERGKDFVFPIGIIFSLLVILIPLPPWMMDVLLALNITISVIVLLTTVYVQTPMEFSVFPSLLLATTLGRLVLNVATTRLILTNGGAGDPSAAGQVIQQFGQFVAGDQLIVGIIIFVIIVLIQFLVITKGATRISEVAARFALDGMPGKQMAIDADLNAGIIDDQTAQKRREEVSQQADFYGAMDGASKFVRGDAIAGIVITVINVVGGFAIGMMAGMELAESAEIFTKLTIGDGLVSQVPAFLISLAAGLLTTRNTQKTNLPTEFMGQLFSRPEALFVAAGFLAILVFTNLPAVPLLTIGGCCVGLALTLRKQEVVKKERAEKKAQLDAGMAQKKQEQKIEDFLTIDPMEMEIGLGLIRLANPDRGGDLLARITGVRQSVASDLGIVLPKVRIRDNMQLGENQYCIKISNNPVAVGEVYPDMLMAMDSGLTTGPVAGIDTTDPAFGQPAKWIEHSVRDRAEMLGYTPVEPAAVMATHLQEVVRKNADEILSRDATKDLIEQAKISSPAVVEELIPSVMKVSEVQQVLQSLLREEVPIRQLGIILETLGDHAARTKDPILLTEYVRNRIARTICTRLRDAENMLRVVTLEPEVEDRIAATIEHSERGLHNRGDHNFPGILSRAIARQTENLARSGYPQVVLVSPQIRPATKFLTQSDLPRLIVMSYNEVTRDTRVEPLGSVAIDGA